MNVTWRILGLQNIPLPDGSSDVVTAIQYVCRAEEYVEEKGWFSAELRAAIMEPVTNAAFIPYTELTEDTILGWVWGSGIDRAQVETELTADIQAQIAAAQGP